MQQRQEREDDLLTILVVSILTTGSRGVGRVPVLPPSLRRDEIKFPCPSVRGPSVVLPAASNLQADAARSIPMSHYKSRAGLPASE